MNQFAETIKQFMYPVLLESHKFGCVLATFDIGDQQRFQEWYRYNIRPDELHSEEGDKGDFHITVKYGLHGGVKPEDVVKALGKYTKGFAEVTLGKISVFPSEEVKEDNYDVVIVEVHSPDLHELNKMIASGVKCTDTYPEYKPHVTLAYMKPGKGKKFLHDRSFSGKKFIFRYLDYTDKEDRTARIHLGVR